MNNLSLLCRWARCDSRIVNRVQDDNSAASAQ